MTNVLLCHRCDTFKYSGSWLLRRNKTQKQETITSRRRNCHGQFVTNQNESKAKPGSEPKGVTTHPGAAQAQLQIQILYLNPCLFLGVV